jgi:hypothetical protein
MEGHAFAVELSTLLQGTWGNTSQKDFFEGLEGKPDR